MNMRLIAYTLLLAIGLILAAACEAPGSVPVADTTLADACVLTPPNAEGPFYTPDTPAKTDFRPEATGGEPLRLTGRVLDANCEPLEGIKVDFWQTDEDGQYDNVGYRLRGHQLTDATGQYALDTVFPGLYPGRPAHIHVKLFGIDGRELLTTQIYFPGAGQADALFDPALTARVEQSNADLAAVSFDFIVAE